MSYQPAPGGPFAAAGEAPPRKKKSSVWVWVGAVLGCGFLLISGVGVFAALGIYGTRKYIENAKSAEAKSALALIAAGMVRCAAKSASLPPSAAPVPASLGDVSGKKYMSAPSDWSAPAWKCAGFSIGTPQYFQYRWARESPSAGTALAVADFNGDGTPDFQFRERVTCSGAGRCTRGPLEDLSR
jgi:hypothetical protein